MHEETHLGSDVPLLPCQVIPHARALQLARRVLEQLDDFSMIRNNGTVFHSRHDKSDVHSRVVMLAWSSVSQPDQGSRSHRHTPS